MQVVINISEKMYEDCKVRNTLHYSLYDFSSMIVNGTPLPKGHGRLIDADRLKLAFVKWSQVVQGSFSDSDVATIVHHSQTIIEADKEVQE